MALQINGNTVVDDNRKFYGGVNCNFYGNTNINAACGSCNVFIGNCAGLNQNVGSGNVAIGNEASYCIYNTYNTISIGTRAGWINTSSSNIFIGQDTARYGQTPNINNVLIGSEAGNCIGGSTFCYNVHIGSRAGFRGSGCCNVFIGFYSGTRTSTGTARSNVAIGSGAAGNLTNGIENVVIGSSAGTFLNTGNCNIFMGKAAGSSITSGCHNIAMGFYSSGSSSTNSYNISMGFCSGRCNRADRNIFIGCCSGASPSTATMSGGDNIFMGNASGRSNLAGNSNVIIGCWAGYQNTSGNCNVFIGKFAGSTNTSGSNNIYINNNGCSTDSNRTIIGNTGTVTTFTYGDFTSEGNVTAYSDESLKDNIEKIENALEKLKQLEGVTYNRNDYPDRPRHMGLIAQCVERVVPEVIGEVDGKLTVAYGNLIALVVEALKEVNERLEKIENAS